MRWPDRRTKLRPGRPLYPIQAASPMFAKAEAVRKKNNRQRQPRLASAGPGCVGSQHRLSRLGSAANDLPRSARSSPSAARLDEPPLVSTTHADHLLPLEASPIQRDFRNDQRPPPEGPRRQGPAHEAADGGAEGAPESQDRPLARRAAITPPTVKAPKKDGPIFNLWRRPMATSRLPVTANGVSRCSLPRRPPQRRARLPFRRAR